MKAFIELRFSLADYYTLLVFSVAVSPDSRIVASASADKTVRLWNARKGQTLQILSGHEGPIRSVAISPDGKLIASGSLDRTARIWEVKSGRIVHVFGDTMEPDGDDGLYTVALSPDGKILASGGTDSRVDLWRLD